MRKGRGGVNLWGQHSSTVFSITLVLFVFGLLLFLEYHSYRITHEMQERITFKVDLVPDISDADALALRDSIAQYPYVKNVDYISKDEAAEIFAADLGEDFVGFLGYNPLYPSLMVNFRSEIIPTNADRVIEQFTKEVGEDECVTGVVYQENVVSELNDVFYKISWILIIFIVLLLFVSVVLINNTIQIALYARRDSIQTMRMVGAEMSFITRPYLRRSVGYGLLGGVFAVALLVLMVSVVGKQFSLNLLKSADWTVYGVMAAVILVSGVIVSYFSTLLAVRRQLRG
ncbi:MAG: permease-like cell division protein FtsX [Bacteroidales bacterium]|nr:permease-like cell division protein FtsX [Bacteroidales bacterium]